MLNGYTPIFSQFGDDIYASDVVQQAISCIALEIKKLQPTHIKNDVDVISISGNIQNVLNNPNPIMTKSDFLEKIIWNLFLKSNSFVIPFYEAGRLTSLYPIDPTSVIFLQDNTENLFIKFVFSNNYETILKYSDVIHIRHKFSKNEFMGGNENGQFDKEHLLDTLQLNKNLLEGITKNIKTGYSLNGVVKYNTMLDDGTMQENLKALEEKIKNSESGFLAMDLKGEFIPLSRNIQAIDEPTLKFIDEKILRNFGVSLPILLGNYTKEQYEAFYQKTLEPIIISLSDAFTKGIFTKREIEFSNKIVFYSKELIFMNTSQKLEMIRLLGDSGAMYENEKREAFGLKPLRELAGIRMQSLNYVNVNIAQSYQLNKEGGEGNENENKE
ncbi:phage portal protein [Clostridioides sp. ES-S-0145-01]|uniref:phage portal protein n=1 Tax=unclassified Clostridioides TaxID=2635829 RepID=UPI001D12D5B5|nr:phage portal protein [Clostridioides sp. ES-S-0145-01]UDN56764.1 phage portal protein [Clostridioides sp. ES-S-0010-02]